MNLDGRWTLHPRVAVRPEPFGALVYHFGTRKLSFLKDPRLVAIVNGLASAPNAREACRQAGVEAHELPAFEAALNGLAASHMLKELPA